jgi:(p)ppGpp synthase/HD superfamily hydrolase
MSEKIQQALNLAREIHKDQRRANGDPYFNHIDLVYRILNFWLNTADYKFTNEWKEILLISVLLHDTIEDGSDKINLEYIEKQFGEDVYNIIKQLTNKFDYYIDYLNSLSDSVKIIKLADILANYYDVLHNPGKNKHQMKHLKNKNEMAFYILFGKKIWEQREIELINNGVI